MRSLFALAAVAALAACQPPAQKPAEAPAPAATDVAPAKTGLELLIDENGATLHDWTDAAAPSFTMTCVRDSATISMSATLSQFAADAKSGEGALVVSGESFKDEAMIQPGEPDAPGIVILTVLMTPQALKALSGATTARLTLGDSFAETSVDSSDTFEKFAAKCSELGKVKAAP